MWLLALPTLFGCAAAADPQLSPSLEADAEYLLTTDDFMEAAFGMAVSEAAPRDDTVLVRTTGAEFVFEPAGSTLAVRQRLGREREAVRVAFPPGALEGLRVTRRGSGAALLANAAESLRVRINADSLLMLQSAEPLALRCEVGFEPASLRSHAGDRLWLDEWGFVGSYHATGSGRAIDRPAERTIELGLAAGQVWWLAVGPPRPYPWAQSLRERVAWHWSMQTGYPADEDIEAWSRHANILLQQSEVMLWKDWSLRFIPRLGIEEFERVNRTCERFGMRNIVYTSPYYFLTGTGLEDRAMNSFDNFAVTGFSPGDGRGLNWPIFLAEITKVMREYRPDGLYFDGIYDNVVRTYLITRKARELVGDEGILEYHATGSPPGGGVYLPQIDTWFTFMLRGEGAQSSYTDPDYLRYFVSTDNISNSIGVLCNNNDYPLDEAFVNTLLDLNIRLHYLPAGPNDQRLAGMKRYYWPALKPDLQARVEAQREARQAAFLAARRDYERILNSRMPDLTPAWREDFADPQLGFALPAAPTEHGYETTLPGGWRGYLSPRSAATIATGPGGLRIEARAHSVAYLERELPVDTYAVECRVRAEGDCGMSWGPGLLLWVGDARARIGLRSDGRAQTDRAGEQILYEDYPPERWTRLRLRIEGRYVLSEIAADDGPWTVLRADRLTDPAAPKRLVVGKAPYDGGRAEYSEVGGLGVCELSEVRVYTRPAQ